MFGNKKNRKNRGGFLADSVRTATNFLRKRLHLNDKQQLGVSASNPLDDLRSLGFERANTERIEIARDTSGDNNVLSGSKFTVVFWWKLTDLPALGDVYGIFTNLSNASDLYGMRLYLYNNAGSYEIRMQVGDTSARTIWMWTPVSAPAGFTAGSWYHATFVFDGTETLEVDRAQYYHHTSFTGMSTTVLTSGGVTTIGASSHNWFIGDDADTALRPLNGKMCQIQVYDGVAQTGAWVGANYNKLFDSSATGLEMGIVPTNVIEDVSPTGAAINNATGIEISTDVPSAITS